MSSVLQPPAADAPEPLADTPTGAPAAEGLTALAPSSARRFGVRPSSALLFVTLCALALVGLALHWRALALARSELTVLLSRLRDLEERVSALCPRTTACHEESHDGVRVTVAPSFVVGAHSGIVTSVARCGGLLVSAGVDGLVHAWSASSPFVGVHIIDRLGESVTSLQASEDGQGLCATLRAGTAEGFVHVWSVRETSANWTSAHSWRAHSGTIHAIVSEQGSGAGGSDGEVVATCSADQTIALWVVGADRVSIQLKSRVTAHKGAVRALVLAGGVLLSAGTDGLLKVWSLADLRPLHAAVAHKAGGVVALAALLSRQPQLSLAPRRALVFSSAEGELKRWRLDAPHPPATSPADERGARASGDALALVEEGAVQLETGATALLALGAGTHPACVLVATTDGRVLGLCPRPGSDARLGLRLVLEGAGDGGWVNALALLSPQRIVSASDDGSLRAWEVDFAAPSIAESNPPQGAKAAWLANAKRGLRRSLPSDVETYRSKGAGI